MLKDGKRLHADRAMERPLGNFTYLNTKYQWGFEIWRCKGDVVKATIVGNVITAYINGVQVLQATDNTYATGSPGMGFYLQGTTGVNSDYGLTSFTASDGSTLAAPANLSAIVH